MVYKHAYLNTLLFSAQLGEDATKRGVRGHALNSHGNYIVDHGESWKNHGIVFSNFCGNPVNIVLDKSSVITSFSLFRAM